jgi:hypothetical protein
MKHLEETGMNYIEHYTRAMKLALWCIKMYTVCIIHAAFPFWFTTTFSDGLKALTKQLEEEENQNVSL